MPVPSSPSYTPEGLRASLDTLILGRRVEFHEQVSSTNDLARDAGRRGEPEGLVIVAEEQVAGRGRLGRVWTAPPGCCVLCSVLLRPRFAYEHAFYLTIAAALAIQRACSTLLAGQVDGSALGPRIAATIKWPNDVLIGGRKVAGVLSESEFSGSELRFSIVGFGINANLDPERLGDLSATATSLSAVLGRPVDRTALLAWVLAELESLYLALQNGQFGLVHSRWVAALETIGKRVTIRQSTGVITGHAVRVDPDGALVVRVEGGDGRERRVVAGDVLPA